MRAPISWLAEHVELPEGATPRQIADRLIAVGLEVEGVESVAERMSGPIVVGRVVAYADEPQKNGKVIRWCRVDVGAQHQDGEPRGIVCGAHNFREGDLVVVALPGAVLPGNFAISARKTYGHVSDGMICSSRELAVGDDHEGILVLPPDSAAPGDDPLDLLGVRDAVLDVAITSDRGYCLSIRGLAREVAAAYDAAFVDVAASLDGAPDGGYDVRLDDPAGCDRFATATVTGLDPTAPTPGWLATRLRQCGMRSISLAVDVTNYVMIETGQPLHAYDRAALRGGLGVRRAVMGERLVTLDGETRLLDPDDLVVTDDSGVIGLGGVMGGASTEIGTATTDVVLEAAHWDPDTIARTVRRHRLPSEAARRFERGVDPHIADVALARCAELLAAHGGATVGGHGAVGRPAPPAAIPFDVTEPGRVAGIPITRQEVVAHLVTVGCRIGGSPEPGPAGVDLLRVEPPSWRPDLLIAADLVEEVVRLVGYDRLPSTLPAAPAGTGLTGRQLLVRDIAVALADAGGVEVISFPFVSAADDDPLGLPADDPRRRRQRLVNPLSEDQPELRSWLLPGLLAAAVRNVGRGNRDLVLFESGLVFEPPRSSEPVPLPGVAARPTDAQLQALDAMLPRQPRHLAGVLTGEIERRGWWGGGRAVCWSDAVELARVAARPARVELAARPVDLPPWHPGRCAQLLIGETVVGHAGELHPRVVAALALPERSCAFELVVDLLPVPEPAPAPGISAYPPVLLDVALVAAEAVPAGELLATLREAAGELLESIRLFDVYVDAERLGPGRRSLAFALRFRAPDRTLTLDEATSLRDAAVAAAVSSHSAQLRS